MAGTPYSGTDGRITVQDDPLNLDGFTVTPEVVDLDMTNSEDGGFPSGMTAMPGAEVEITGMYDSEDPPFDSLVANLRPGQIVGPMLLYVSKPDKDDKFFNFPLARVISAPVTSKVEDKVCIKVRLRSQGPWFYPT